MEETLNVPQTPVKVVDSTEPKVSKKKPQEEGARKKKRVRDPEAPKRVPNKWQNFIKEKCAGKKFGSQKDSQEHMKACAAEYKKMSAESKKQEQVAQ